MKKIIYFITLLFLVGCVDLSENMYNDLGKDNYYQTEQEYDAAFMNQYAFLRTMYAWNVFYLQEITTDEACYLKKGETVMTEVSTNVCIGTHGPTRMSLSTEHGRNCSKRWVSAIRC